MVGLFAGLAGIGAALILMFLGGFYWRDGSKLTATLNVFASLVMIIGQTFAALAWLGEHLPPR